MRTCPKTSQWNSVAIVGASPPPCCRWGRIERHRGCRPPQQSFPPVKWFLSLLVRSSPTLRFDRATMSSMDPSTLRTSLASPHPHCWHLCLPRHPRPQVAPPAGQPRLCSHLPDGFMEGQQRQCSNHPGVVAGRHLLANLSQLLHRRQPLRQLHNGPRLQERLQRRELHHHLRPRWRPYRHRRLR